jgi:hypothetical protein
MCMGLENRRNRTRFAPVLPVGIVGWNTWVLPPLHPDRRCRLK